MRKLVALFLVCFPLQAFGEVLHYSKCGTNEGKTIDDAQKWLNDWRALAKRENINYHVRILVPHADPQMRANEFFIESGSATLESYANAWQWWYTDPDAAASNKQRTAATNCDLGAIYRSTD